MQNLINRLRFEMTCSSDEQAVRVGADFGHTLQPILVSVMDRVCSRHSTEEQWLRLDKLEINLPVFANGLLDESLLEAEFESRFEAALVGEMEPAAPEIRYLSRRETTLDTLLYFLKTGQLPWWTVADLPEPSQLLAELIREHPDAVRLELPPLIRQEPVLRRVLYQFTTDTLETLLTQCFPEMVRLFNNNHIRQRLHADFPDVNSDVFTKPPILAEIYVRLLPYLANEQVMKDKLPAILALVTGLSGRESTYDQPADTQPKKPVIGGLTEKAEAEWSESVHWADTPLSATETPLASAEGRSYHVTNAGIVLLTPFLNLFFSGLGWIDAGEFVNEEARYKAIHSLHYLAAGQKQAPEPVLTLAKFLCGISPETPIPREVDLTEADYAEAETLLTEVVAHWTALKNTSTGSLRDSFLQRDGVLAFTGEHWTLQVERKTIDVLLDTIPWGFSVVKLPWMSNLFYTTW